MKRFRRRGQQVSSSFEPQEVDLLASLVGQLVELLQADEAEPEQQSEQSPSTDDPFAFWERGMAEMEPAPDHDDPVLRRLFPNPYPHDPEAASDFRRFTERDLRDNRIRDARDMLAGLERARADRGTVKLTPAEAQAWLKTLTAVRLSVATRLGITDAESAEEVAQVPDSDPRAFMYQVYEWLGFAQETLVTAL